MPKCRFPDCDADKIEGSTLCMLHHMQRELYRKAKRGGRSTERGFLASLSNAAAFVLDPRNPVGKVVGTVAKDYADEAEAFVAMASEQGQPFTEQEPPDIEEEAEEEEVEDTFEWEEQYEAPKTLDGWAVLGLDKKKATEDDIRKRQRKLAAIYHTDTSEAEEAENIKMKEINEAASMCIEEVKKRKAN